MSRYNAMDERYTEVLLFGMPVLFTNIRIDRATVPSNLYLYEIRHADEDWGDPCQIAKGILVNHFGTVISNKPIVLGKDGYRDFVTNEFCYTDGKCHTIKEYIARYPAKKEKYYER